MKEPAGRPGTLLAWFTLWLFLAGEAVLADVTLEPSSMRQPDRDFGYTLGDVLTQDIALPSAQPRPDLAELNTEARVSNWLERQGATRIDTRDGPAVRLHYQIVNVPDRIRKAELPASNLSLPDGSVLTWQAWPFTLGPLTSPDTSMALKADDTLPAYDTRQLQTRLKTSLLVMGVVLASYGLWWLWRSMSDRHRLPFARAEHRLRQRKVDVDGSVLDDWKIVHEAFNARAGRVVTGSDLPGLLEQQGWMRGLDNEVKAFFDASSARFFSRQATETSFDLRAFARRMAAEERRHAV